MYRLAVTWVRENRKVSPILRTNYIPIPILCPGVCLLHSTEIPASIRPHLCHEDPFHPTFDYPTVTQVAPRSVHRSTHEAIRKSWRTRRGKRVGGVSRVCFWPADSKLVDGGTRVKGWPADTKTWSRTNNRVGENRKVSPILRKLYTFWYGLSTSICPIYSHARLTPHHQGSPSPQSREHAINRCARANNPIYRHARLTPRPPPDRQWPNLTPALGACHQPRCAGVDQSPLTDTHPIIQG